MKKTTVLQWIFAAAVTMCLGIPFMVAGFLQRGLARKGRVFRVLSKLYSRILFAGFRVRVVTRWLERIDPQQAYVFMANHASIADPLAVAIAVPHPLHFVFKREFARIPVFGWALLSLGQIMVDREDREQAKVALAGAASGLSGNNSVIIFSGGVGQPGRNAPAAEKRRIPPCGPDGPVLLAALFAVLPVTLSAAESRPPRLVLQITVDALRADMPGRFSPHYGDGGWRYLLEQGLHYTSAYYEHANTETIVGHASLATGAYPADHGMVANVWLDREDGSLHYNIEDPAYVLLTAGGGVDARREIDPTQRTARSDGRSPRAIRVSTFGDELASHSGGRAKVFAVSAMAKREKEWMK